MSKQIIVVGGVALGPKVACRIKRLDPTIKVTIIDKDNLISYGGCGIPYYVGGDVSELEGLRSTMAHVLRDEAYFKNIKGVDVITRAEVFAIDRVAKVVHVRHLDTNKEETLSYDQLVLSTGSMPIIPPLPGVDLKGVTPVANLHHASFIKDQLSNGRVKNAVVIGGGAIGIEMAEALSDLWGVETTLIEMTDQLLPQAFGKDMALLIKNNMEKKGVQVLLSEKVTQLNGNNDNFVQSVQTTCRTIPCDLVIMAAGVRPNGELAKQSGIATGVYGGILVDQQMRTSDPSIFAGGDCVELCHLVSGKNIPVALGSLANRQGRVIGTTIAGKRASFLGTVGSFCIKIFDLGVARAGLTSKQAKDAGFDPVHSVVVQADRAHFYPTMNLMMLKLIADRKSRRVLGVEAIGQAGDAVKARVDAVAPLLHHNITVDDISNLEVAYAPPFASAMDIINNAANSLDNIIEGRQNPIDVIDFLDMFKNGTGIVLDVRNPIQGAPFVKQYGDRWCNINQEELIHRLNDVPKQYPLFLVCGSGPRSYETQLLLKNHQWNHEQMFNVQGGMGMIKGSDLDFELE